MQHSRAALFLSVLLGFVGSAQGTPSAASCARVGQATCEAYDSAKSNWTAFHKELLANRAQMALALVHPGCAREIGETLLAEDADLVAFAKSVVDFEVVDSILSFEGSPPKAKGSVTAALILKIDDRKQMFLVTFAQDKDKSWKLCTI